MNLFRPVVHRGAIKFASKYFCRGASLNTAIWEGMRREAREESRAFDRSRSRDRDEDADRDEPSYTPSLRIRHLDPCNSHRPRRVIKKVDENSDWIYGTNIVEAALKAGRRTMHRLYVYAGENRTSDSRERDIAMKNLARRLKVDIQEVRDVGILDSMSSGRPHNGYVLEASPILKIPIISLGAVSRDKSTISLQIAQHDITNSGIVLNNLPRTINSRDTSRHPLILMLDEILDPGNLGAILRTAYYLGCSALLLAHRNCAPLSPTCLKSSAGASEYMPILTHAIPQRLIENSKTHGWKFFAAVPLPGRNKKRKGGGKYIGIDSEEVQEALKTGPTVLVLGGESEGLRRTVEMECDRLVSIRSASDVEEGVDSLNVSVAAGVLCQAFLVKR